MAKWLGRSYPQFGSIEAALFQQDGTKLVYLMRLSPFLPDRCAACVWLPTLIARAPVCACVCQLAHPLDVAPSSCSSAKRVVKR